MNDIQPTSDNSLSRHVEQDENDLSSIRSISQSIRSISQSTHGVKTVLQYPIVTEPTTKRKLYAKEPISFKKSHNKEQSFSSTLKRKTKQFLGLDEDDKGEREFLWTERRIRLANRKYGGIDVEKITKTLPKPRRVVDSPDGELVSQHYTYTTYPRYL